MLMADPSIGLSHRLRISPRRCNTTRGTSLDTHSVEKYATIINYLNLFSLSKQLTVHAKLLAHFFGFTFPELKPLRQHNIGK